MIKRLCTFFSFLGLFLCFQSSGHAQTIILCTGEWAPYTSKTMNGNGAFTEIVSAVFKKMGAQPIYQFYPWKRGEKITREGEAFAVFPYKITSERKKFFYFSKQVMSSTGRFFYLKNNFPKGINYTKFEDLSPYKIGGILGYWYEKPFKKANLRVYYTATDEESIKRLYNNRIQIVASEELVGWALIKRLYPREISKFDTMEKPMNQDQLHLMVSKKYPNAKKLLKGFNMALEKIRTQGIVHQILKKHGVK